MTKLKTNESLLRALKSASGRVLSSEDIEKQRVSFILGSLKASSGVTREKVRGDSAKTGRQESLGDTV